MKPEHKVGEENFENIKKAYSATFEPPIMLKSLKLQ